VPFWAKRRDAQITPGNVHFLDNEEMGFWQP